MSRFLIHIHSGSDQPTKAALGCLVALVALKDGHEADLFLAGDGVVLMAPATLATLEGEGTGRLAEHFEGLRYGGARFHVCADSAAARGIGEAELQGLPAELVGLEKLLELAESADVVLSY